LPRFSNAQKTTTQKTNKQTNKQHNGRNIISLSKQTLHMGVALYSNTKHAHVVQNDYEKNEAK
jgi:hypothetical protein